MMDTLTKEVEERCASGVEDWPKGATIEFNLAIVATDSTLVYYQLSSGLHYNC